MDTAQLLAKFTQFIIDPLLLLLSAVGLLVFVWGVVEFLWAFSNESETKEQGKKHMIYGLVGLFIIFTAAALINLVANTVCNGGGVSNCVPHK
jgi:uncharacterized membrane protein HdeD (DUF308 family)